MWSALTIVKFLLSIADTITRRMEKDNQQAVGAHLSQLEALQNAIKEQGEADIIRERVRRGELGDPFLRHTATRAGDNSAP